MMPKPPGSLSSHPIGPGFQTSRIRKRKNATSTIAILKRVAPGGTISDLRGLRSLGTDGIAVLDMPPEQLTEMMSSSLPLDYDPSPSVHAGAYVYLASKARTGAVTGTIIHSDGGLGVRGMMRVAGLK